MELDKALTLRDCLCRPATYSGKYISIPRQTRCGMGPSQISSRVSLSI